VTAHGALNTPRHETRGSNIVDWNSILLFGFPALQQVSGQIPTGILGRRVLNPPATLNSLDDYLGGHDRFSRRLKWKINTIPRTALRSVEQAMYTIAEDVSKSDSELSQLVRYYGYYNNVSRGKRKKAKPEDKTEISEIDAPPLSKELKRRWSPNILDFRFWICDYGTKRKRTEFDVSDAFIFSLIENRQSKIQNHLTFKFMGKISGPS
jgi:hypothetical protein